jgi:lipopolysaccharide heptosyltransferase I
MKILIIKLSAIGDVIHALPVAHFLKNAIPGVEISWMVEQMSSSLVTDNPAVDKPIVFPGKRWLKEIFSPHKLLANSQESAKFFSQLRSEKFDAVIELQGLLKSSLLARSAGAPVVVGFDDTREFADRMLTHKLNVGDYFGPDVPVVELNLRLAKFALAQLGLPIPEIEVLFPLPQVAPELYIRIESLLKAPDSVATPLVVLIPGTTWVTKIWPAQKWVSVATRLAALGHKIIFVGGKSEVAGNASLTAEVARAAPQAEILDLTDRTSLLELIPLFQRSPLVIGADTGPLHLAAAVGVPRVIGVFGSTPWKRNGPYGEQCKTISLALECQPCYAKTCKFDTVDCLRQLDSELVIDAAIEALGQRP